MDILGISAYYHDSAACLLRDGVIRAAARFTRKKHDAGFPPNAVRYCLAEGGSTLRDVAHVVYYVVLTPIGVIRRSWGQDPMRRGFDSRAETYRVPRQVRPAAHMRRRFQGSVGGRDDSTDP